MSNIALSPNASGNGTFTLTAPNTASNYTLTLPSQTGTLIIDDGGGNITVSGSLTLSAGTANGVLYLNGSKVLTTGSGLTYNGSTLATTGALTIDGNTTLGNASTDTVTVNGYMGVGGAGQSNSAVVVQNSSLTGIGQYGVTSQITGSSAATQQINAYDAYPQVANASFTVADVRGFSVRAGLKGASATATNWHGVYIADQTQGTNNYGITSLVSSGTNKWNIYASGTAQNYFAGNVGIGTSSPTNALQLVGTAKVSSQIYVGSNSDDNYSGGIQNLSNISRSISIQADPTNSGASTILTFGVDGSERMRIDSSGNVGIGTSAPSYKLDLSGGTFGCGAITSSGNLNLSITGASDAAPCYFYFNSTLAFARNGTGERMRIDTSGNVQLSTAGTSILNSSGRAILNQTGGILQVVSTNKTDTFSTTSTSFTDITGLSVTITPSSTSSRIVVFCDTTITAGGGSGGFYGVRLMRDSTAIDIGATAGSRTRASYGSNTQSDDNMTKTGSFNFVDSPATTSAVTYKLQAQVYSSGTIYINRQTTDSDSAGYGRFASTITVMEIAG